MPFAVIMAGGRGERFWPRSRMAKPKQFLNLIGEKTMLQLTVERIKDLVGISDTFIVAGSEFKDTDPATALRKHHYRALWPGHGRSHRAGRPSPGAEPPPQEVMIVLPADHYIGNVRNFQKVLRSAVALFARNEDNEKRGLTKIQRINEKPLNF